MWKLLVKMLMNVYVCLLLYVVFSVALSTRYGGAASYSSESGHYSFLSYTLTVYLYVFLMFFPAYLIIPAGYHFVVYHFRIQSIRALIIGAGIAGSTGALLFMGLRLMKSNYWVLDILGLGIIGVIYGWLDAFWVRKRRGVQK